VWHEEALRDVTVGALETLLKAVWCWETGTQAQGVEQEWQHAIRLWYSEDVPPVQYASLRSCLQDVEVDSMGQMFSRV
jgi:hypothetical protein